MSKGRARVFTLVIYILLVLMMVLLWMVNKIGFGVVAGLFAVYGFIRCTYDLTALMTVTAEEDARKDAELQAKFDARIERREVKRQFKDEAQMQKLAARNGRHSDGWAV